MTPTMNPEQLSLIPWESTLCFTGHRPEKLPEGAVLRGLQQTIYYAIRRAVAQGYTHFLTGMADGVDYIAAYYLFHLRMKNPALRVIGVQPCSKDYDSFFRANGYSVPHLRLMQQNVDELVVLPGSAWNRRVYARRNRVMVEHASGIIAVCRDGRSGSMMTYQYARQHGLAYYRIYPDLPDGSIPSPQDWPAECSGF